MTLKLTIQCLGLFVLSACVPLGDGNSLTLEGDTGDSSTSSNTEETMGDGDGDPGDGDGDPGDGDPDEESGVIAVPLCEAEIAIGFNRNPNSTDEEEQFELSLWAGGSQNNQLDLRAEYGDLVYAPVDGRLVGFAFQTLPNEIPNGMKVPSHPEVVSPDTVSLGAGLFAVFCFVDPQNPEAGETLVVQAQNLSEGFLQPNGENGGVANWYPSTPNHVYLNGLSGHYPDGIRIPCAQFQGGVSVTKGVSEVGKVGCSGSMVGSEAPPTVQGNKVIAQTDPAMCWKQPYLGLKVHLDRDEQGNIPPNGFIDPTGVVNVSDGFASDYGPNGYNVLEDCHMELPGWGMHCYRYGDQWLTAKPAPCN